MMLWTQWLQAVFVLRPACHRARTFLWMLLVLMGLCCRADNAGVTSFVRVLNFRGQAYHRFLHLFHSTGLDLDVLTTCWARLCLVLFRPFEVGSRLVCLADGIKAVVKQQFEVARQVLSHGLVPIVEPEVDIKNPDKKGSEAVLKKEILAELDKLPANQQVMLKLTIPDVDNFYAELIKHPRVLKVVALSGGYSRDEANKRLARQHGMIASFSRALSEGLTAQQSDAEFNKSLDTAIQSIYDASKT